jgi:hypothetical protein
MPYCRDTWTFPNSIEYEYKYAGNYGAKGEKRSPKRKATPEQILKQNQFNREKYMRRLIKRNYAPDDLWNTLKYPKGTRKLLGEIKKDIKYFHTAMRKEFKKYDELYKFIIRFEIGERGGIHIHILINRPQSIPNVDLLIKEIWKFGYVNYQSLYEYGGYQKLANYIVKRPSKEQEKQLSLFEEEDRKELIKYSSSRNLIRPEPERKEYRRWTMKRIVEDGPKPTTGYYIDKDSIRYGVNEYTGMSYYQYTECRIKEIKSRSSPEWKAWEGE